MKVSFIVTSCNRLHHLAQTLPSFLHQPESEVVVVTGNQCQQKTSAWLGQRYSDKVRRVDAEKPYSLAHYRHLGAIAATGEWFCFFDGDIELSARFSEHFLKKAVPGNFYTSAEWDGGGVFGSTAIHRADYFSVQGFDSRFTSYGHEEIHIWKLLCAAGKKHCHLPPLALRHINHNDDDRVVSYNEKDKSKSQVQNARMSESLIALSSVAAKLRAEDQECKQRWADVWTEAQKIDSWTQHDEVFKLFDAARRLPDDARIIEVGAFRGRTTYAMGATGRQITTIDPMIVGSDLGGGRLLTVEDVAALKKTVSRFDNISWYRGTTRNFQLENEYDMAFIDGSHEYQSVMADLLRLHGSLKKGAVLFMHDVGDGYPGVERAIDEAIRSGLIRHVRTTAFLWEGFTA